MTDLIRFAHSSDPGEQKSINQDAGCSKQLDDGWILLAVADGVSMSNKPEVASAVAINTSQAFLACQKITSDNAEGLIKAAIHRAHQAILNIPKKRFSYKLADPQTTIVLALIKNTEVFVGWVGDSRAYVLGDNCALQLTEDDSYMNWAIKSGLEKYDPRLSHAITQCLGMREDNLIIHTASHTIKKSDDILLCTDGLWNYYDKPDSFFTLYNTICEERKDARDKTEYLVHKANEKGGEDNITVALYQQDFL